MSDLGWKSDEDMICEVQLLTHGGVMGWSNEEVRKAIVHVLEKESG